MTALVVRIAGLLATVCLACTGAAFAAEPGGNRLAGETSPYLRLHAGNPVHWFPWGPEAFAAAKAQNKPIFLSIGYSSCHWCHVMNRESFSDAKTAATLNEHFICIKLDREERPDVDRVYLDAVQALTRGGGGWPLSVFLLPDGRPFFGGTYFPPADKRSTEGKLLMPGFPTVLAFVQEAYAKRPADVEKQADVLVDFLRRSSEKPVVDAAPLSVDLISEAIAALLATFDPEFGGLGQPPTFAPKFPQASVGLFLIHAARGPEADRRLSPIVQQADRMARGGIFDQIGGGFHRYTVDREWSVPHFEKMLYDQGQLLSFYSRLLRAKPDPLYRRVIDQTVQFVRREMTSPEGLFYSALDADSEHVEGKYYVWSKEELSAALGPDADWLLPMLGVGDEPNFEGKYIPTMAQTPAQAAQRLGVPEPELLQRWSASRGKLLDVRSRRVRPLRDEKAIASWNALMIIGLADAAVATGDAGYKQLAQQTLDAVLANMYREGSGLSRQFIAGQAKGRGFADDYASMILALLAVDRLESSNRCVAAAEEMATTLLEEFWDPESKGFFYTGKDHESLFFRAKESYDGAVPSSGATATEALLQLAARTGRPTYRQRAGEALAAVRQRLVDSPIGSTMWLLALDHYLAAQPQAPTVALASSQAPAKKKGTDPIARLTVEPPAVDARPGQTVRFRVAVELADRWHVNANPASPDYLKPTTIRLIGRGALEQASVKYPPGQRLVVGGVEEPAMVYSGKVSFEVAAKVSDSAEVGEAEATFELGYQACDDQKCLAPSKRPFKVALRIRPAQ